MAAPARLEARSGADLPVGLAIAGLAALPPLRAVLGLPGWSYLLALGLLLVAALLRLLTRRSVVVPVPAAAFAAVSLVLFAWLILSVAWTASTRQFLGDLLLLVGLIVVVPSVVLVATPRAASHALAAITVAAVFVSFVVFAQYLAAGALVGYNVQLLEYYLTISTLLALGAVVAFTHAAALPGRRVLWAIAGLLSLGGLALSLARGALLFSFLLIATFGLTGIFTSPVPRDRVTAYIAGMSRRLVAAMAVAVVLGAGIWGAFQVERTRDKLVRLFSGGELTTEGSRAALWVRSWQSIGEAPLRGYGLGSSGRMSALVEQTHPHNLFLQAWLDGGVVGFLLLATAISLPFVVAAYRTWSAGIPRAALPALAGYCLLILEYSKSYNLYTGRTLFAFGAVVLIVLAAHPAIGADRR